MRLHAAVLFAASLGLAAAPAAAAPARPVHPSPGARVVPRTAEGLTPVELPQLVRALMPAKSVKAIGWTYAHGLPGLRWGATDELTGMPDPNAAWVRVRRQGRVFRAPAGEVAWTVELRRADKVEIGPPTWIEISPTDEGCYGKDKAPCVFRPAEAFRGAGLKAVRMCEYGLTDDEGAGGDETIAYEVSAPGRQDVVVVYAVSGGSGIQSSWLELRPFVVPWDVCAKLADDAWPAHTR